MLFLHAATVAPETSARPTAQGTTCQLGPRSSFGGDSLIRVLHFAAASGLIDCLGVDSLVRCTRPVQRRRYSLIPRWNGGGTVGWELGATQNQRQYCRQDYRQSGCDEDSQQRSSFQAHTPFLHDDWVSRGSGRMAANPLPDSLQIATAQG